MFNHPFHYPIHRPYPPNQMNQQMQRTYPPIDVKMFASSVKSFRLLMEQGSILLDRLGDAGFSKKMMSAAQQGKNEEVDHLVKSIGLKIPVVTKYTPSGVIFELITVANQQNPESCCTLTIAMKWGK